MEQLSAKDLTEYYKTFSELKKEDQITEVARLLALYTNSRAYPIILDNGTMLDDNGHYKNDFRELLRIFASQYPDHYLILIHNRLPKLSYADSTLVYRKRVNALDQTSCLSAFDALLKRNDVVVRDFNQIKEISEYLDGYPPAITFAVNECVLEGVDVVCKNKSALIDFQSGIFSGYLSSLPLSKNDNLVLSALYHIGDMTIEILSAILGIDEELVTVSVLNCLDFSILEERNNGMYGIARPISVAVGRKYPRYTQNEYSRIAHILIEKYWNEGAPPNIDIVNLMIDTILKANIDTALQKFRDFILPSNLLKAAKEANLVPDWPLAEKYVRKAIELDDTLDDARSLLFKLLVRRENQKNLAYLEAEENDIIAKLENNHYRWVYYLKGFRECKRRNYDAAIEAFILAKQSGDDSIPLHRDLAECYYQTNNIKAAQKEIQLLLEPSRKINNAFILDLAAKIAICAEDYTSAESFIVRQGLIDRPENVDHRKATLYYKMGEYSTAIIYATNACQGPRSLPQMHLLRMNIAIQLSDYDIVEEEKSYIKTNCSWHHNDIAEVFYCNMLLRRNGWEQAEAAFHRIRNKTNAVALYLREKILDEKVKDTFLSITDKTKAQSERSKISKYKTRDVMLQMQFYDSFSEDVDLDYLA